MNFCAYADQVEDFALGILDGDERRRVGAHIERCGACRDSLRVFEEERAIFRRRASFIVPPPEVFPVEDTRASAAASAPASLRAVRESRWRLAHIAPLVLACAASFFLVTKFGSSGHDAIGSNGIVIAQAQQRRAADGEVASWVATPASRYAARTTYPSRVEESFAFRLACGMDPEEEETAPHITSSAPSTPACDDPSCTCAASVTCEPARP